jgi:hypothetical protein
MIYATCWWKIWEMLVLEVQVTLKANLNTEDWMKIVYFAYAGKILFHDHFSCSIDSHMLSQ